MARPTGRIEVVGLEGMVFAWDESYPGPVLISEPESDDAFLPLFSSVDDLKKMMKLIGIKYTNIFLVENTETFVDSIPLDIKLVSGLRVTEEGKFRWLELARSGGSTSVGLVGILQKSDPTVVH